MSGGNNHLQQSDKSTMKCLDEVAGNRDKDMIGELEK